MFMSFLQAFAIASAAVASGPLEPVTVIEPRVLETRTVALTQTVVLRDIPANTGKVRMWTPIPSDSAWQRVIDRQVVSAPGAWKLVRQEEGRGDFIYVEFDNPPAGEASIIVKCVVERAGVQFPLESAAITENIQPALFEADLDPGAPLMTVNPEIKAMADKACGDERDPAHQALALMRVVADVADHYSKDPSKPKCGRGAAEDCLEQGGGCCTDLHSLFIALARARGIPARMQYGYRLLDAKAGAAYDPGYRCWVEFFVPGAGWVPTDIVAADGAAADVPAKWAALSATRVWLWQGRSFELTPAAKAGRIDTMICGWAEIDGKPVDVLPAADGTPSKLTRTVQFEVLNTDRTAATPKVAE
jgi:transglutaminase-like putative cysteine protease